MSWRDFASITAKFPRDAGAIRRLHRLVRESRGGRDYTFQRLYDLTQPSSPESLALILAELEQRGLVRRVFRVESPETHGGIADYRSLDEIPRRLHDWHTDQDLDVEPRHVRPIFRIA